MDRRSEVPADFEVDAAGAVGLSCPIAPALLDGTATRIAAALSVTLAALVVGRGWDLGFLALAGDFALRGLGRPELSPVARTAGFLRRFAGLPERRTNAGPKRFAAQVGGLFSLGAGLALLLGFRPLGLGLAATLGVCAALEAFFGFCVACRLYPRLPWNRA